MYHLDSVRGGKEEKKKGKKERKKDWKKKNGFLVGPRSRPI